MDPKTTYEEKKQRLAESLKAGGDTPVRLAKDTSNLFRDRRDTGEKRLNVRDFNTVLEVNPGEGYAEAEGMTPYAELVHECLRNGVMPTVVPELKSITIGGAATGLGIESSSFKFGLVHETLQELEILRGDGSIVVARPDNDYSDLFYGFPNSYGTLGYALRVRVKTTPVKPYVKLRHIRYRDAGRFFAELAQWCEKPIDFVDGTVFGPSEMYLTIGEFVEEAPYTSDYSFLNIYYRSIREKEEDFLTVHDYIWRWDTDWFWCSKNVFAQNPLVRRLYGPSRLNSVTYTKIMRWNSRWKLTGYLNRLMGLYSESVIQDIQVPVENANAFFEFYFSQIQLTPLWICPTRAWDPSAEFALYKLDPKTLYINFGFWDVIKGRKQRPEGYFNRLIEEKVVELSGMKSLYSDVYFPEDEFWKIYNGPAYEALKAKYDPQGRLKDLYRKCVLKE